MLNAHSNRFEGRTPLFNDGFHYALDGWLKELGNDMAE
jgi:hypothetical protein